MRTSCASSPETERHTTASVDPSAASQAPKWSATRRALLVLAAVFATLLLTACQRQVPTEAASTRPVVVVSTTMLADLVASIAGDSIELVALVRPGADPHLYQPTPSDARAIARGSLVVRNGLGLEGWLDDLTGAETPGRLTVTASDAVTALHDETGVADPHFWFDPARWKQAAATISEALLNLHVGDPAVFVEIAARRDATLAAIEALDVWARACLETVPSQQRVLVTSHDAFQYWGAAFGFEVVAIQGISTEQEASHHDVARVIDLVRSRSVPAIFVETSVNRGLLEQVGRETGVALRGPLYSDSLGDIGTPAATWIGMMTENTQMIVTSLGGQCERRQ